MKRFTSLFITVLIFSFSLNGQENNYRSTHKFHKDHYDSFEFKTTEEYDALNQYKVINTNESSKDCVLETVVFGWHPYWMGSAYENYQWNLLTDVSFFSYEVDPATGEPTDTHGWETTPLVDSAQANGVRVNLCVTLFEDHALFFGNSTAQQTLITNLITLVNQRNANGVNIDVELLPSSQTVPFNNFLVDLCEQMHAAIPGSQVSIALHSVDWYDIYDIPTLKDYIDLFIIMGYDYYWPGSSVAGPTGQLYKMSDFNYTISRSIIDYLHAGVPHDKLVCGLPYYGWEWETLSDDVPAYTDPPGVARTIKTLKNNSNGYYSNKLFDPNSMCEYYNYYSGGTWNQLWIDDEIGMKYKYDVVQQQGIAGIGIWALGYDDGYTEMWDLIENTFTDCAVKPCSYLIYDMGGPTREHFNYEDYTFTIAPDEYTDYLALAFYSFELEAGWDSLWIYDGVDTNAPLIGGYSGTTSPGIIEASGHALCLKFHSNNLTVKHGWTAEWMCEPLGLNKLELSQIEVYPNPASDHVFIDAKGLQEVQIISRNGRILKIVESYEIDLSELKNGLYFLKIITDTTVSIKKIIVNK